MLMACVHPDWLGAAVLGREHPTLQRGGAWHIPSGLHQAVAPSPA